LDGKEKYIITEYIWNMTSGIGGGEYSTMNVNSERDSRIEINT